MKTEDKGKKYICWRESGRLRLAGESRFIKKGLSTGSCVQAASCKDKTDSKVFWSSSEYSSNNACNVNFNSNGNLNLNNNNKNNSNNKVRCVFASLIEPNNSKQ